VVIVIVVSYIAVCQNTVNLDATIHLQKSVAASAMVETTITSAIAGRQDFICPGPALFGRGSQRLDRNFTHGIIPCVQPVEKSGTGEIAASSDSNRYLDRCFLCGFEVLRPTALSGRWSTLVVSDSNGVGLNLASIPEAFFDPWMFGVGGR
jgi:hypothetical protein